MSDVVTFIVGLAIGALTTWYTAHRYYLKAAADQKAEIDRLTRELRPKNTLEDFGQFLRESKWEKAYIDNSEVWSCNADNTFQIRIGEREREFKEPWTSVYPDQAGGLYPVYLSINSVVVKQLFFVAMDGGRIFVPMAEIRPREDDVVEYFWNVNSLEVIVCRVIGQYYIYKDLESIARRSGVAIVE